MPRKSKAQLAAERSVLELMQDEIASLRSEVALLRETLWTLDLPAIAAEPQQPDSGPVLLPGAASVDHRTALLMRRELWSGVRELRIWRLGPKGQLRIETYQRERKLRTSILPEHMLHWASMRLWPIAVPRGTAAWDAGAEPTPPVPAT